MGMCADDIIREMEQITNMRYSEEQLRILRHTGGMRILACAGSGKALKNGTGVLTPSGYIPIEELGIGDVCYDENGEEQIITGVFPQGKKQVYKVVLSDGAVIECCKDHIWNYQTYNMRRTTKKWKNDTLEYIMNNVPISVYPHTNCLGETHNRANIYIPMAKAINFGEKALPIKPYLLGALLGDGGIKSSCVNCNYSFSNMDEDVVERVEKELMEVRASLRDKGDGKNFNISVGNGHGRNSTEGLLTLKLKELGLKDLGSHNKFIPEVYKHSSVKDRLELLQGLMDTDGSCGGTFYEITLMSERLIDDIKFIVESLGMTAVKSVKNAVSINKEYGCANDAYRLYIETSKEIPKIHWSKRRESQWKKGQTYARRTMREIIKTEEYAEMTCIKVSNPNGLFITENCVVTHNTTILTHLLAKRIKSGEIKDTKKLLCTTFSKAGSSEMEERLGVLFKMLGINQKLQVSTLHASYYKVLKRFGMIGGVCTAGQRIKMVSDSCKDAGVRNLSNEDLQLVDSLLSYQVNNLLSDDALIKSYVYTLNDVTPEQYSAIRYGYNKRKEESGTIDFDDMQLYMYMLLVVQKNQDVLNYCRSMWTDFFIDEFQDVSKIQFAITRELITDPSRLIVIGDDDQCIYQWRGADPNILLDICGYYDIQSFVLSTNYRCGGEIVKRAAVGIKNNERRSEKEMIPYNIGGTIRLCDVRNTDLYQMSRYAHKHIKDLINSGVRHEDIVVLSRNNQHVSILNNLLFRDGVYSNTVPEMKMTISPIYKDIRNLIKLSENTYNHNLIESMAWKVCSFLGTRGSKDIAEFMGASGLSIKDALGYILTTYLGSCRVDWNGKVNIPAKADNRARYKFQLMREDIIVALENFYKVYKLNSRHDRLYKLTGMYLSATDFMYRSKDRVRHLHGLVRYISEMVDTEDFEGAEAFLRLTEQYEGAKMHFNGPRINMSTIHGAKGKEWKHVIVFADDNITFPSFEGIGKMLEDRVEIEDISGSIDENRRLHYVAMTRAKEDLTIFADKDNLSVYALESLGMLNKGGNRLNKHIIKMAEDGGLPEGLRGECVDKLFSEGSEYYYNVNIGG